VPLQWSSFRTRWFCRGATGDFDYDHRTSRAGGSALENAAKLKLSWGVWKPIGDIAPSGGVEVYHTVLKERFRVVVTDYNHTEPPTKEPV
jgi:hypothetical protein